MKTKTKKMGKKIETERIMAKGKSKCGCDWGVDCPVAKQLRKAVADAHWGTVATKSTMFAKDEVSAMRAYFAHQKKWKAEIKREEDADVQ